MLGNSSPNLLVLLLAVLSCLTDGRGLVRQDTNSIVMTMIIRDEAVNIKSNLHLWLGIIDYFVFLVDTRTVDDSKRAIQSILDPRRVPYEIVSHEFDGFGSSRTRSLENAWKYFPQATYVWIADPDWRPDVSTIQKRTLTREYDAFRFTIIDRSGITTRRCDWLLRHREGLAMKYHLHEVLDIGLYNPVGVEWVVHEIEQPGSWHTTVGHANSFAAKRTLFDLDLLYKDLEQYGHDPHSHKYLGVTHLAYVIDLVVTKTPEGLDTVTFSKDTMTAEVNDHYQKGIHFCEIRVNPSTVYDDEFREERWDCMLQMALTSSILGYLDTAEKWYVACHEFSPGEPRCMYSLVSMLDQSKQVDRAFHFAQTLISMKTEAREGINFRGMGNCLMPKVALPVLLKYANVHNEYPVTEGFVLYLQMLVRMMGTAECDGFVSLSDIASLKEIVDVMSALMDIAPSRFASVAALCEDENMRGFVHEHGYTLHHCDLQ